MVPECDHPVQGRRESVRRVHPSARCVTPHLCVRVLACGHVGPVYLRVCIFESDTDAGAPRQNMTGGAPLWVPYGYLPPLVSDTLGLDGRMETGNEG